MKTKIGLLPLYLKLYDDCVPEKRAAMEEFLQGIICEFRRREIAVAISKMKFGVCDEVRGLSPKLLIFVY